MARSSRRRSGAIALAVLLVIAAGIGGASWWRSDSQVAARYRASLADLPGVSSVRAREELPTAAVATIAANATSAQVARAIDLARRRACCETILERGSAVLQVKTYGDARHQARRLLALGQLGSRLQSPVRVPYGSVETVVIRTIDDADVVPVALSAARAFERLASQDDAATPGMLVRAGTATESRVSLSRLGNITATATLLQRMMPLRRDHPTIHLGFDGRARVALDLTTSSTSASAATLREAWSRASAALAVCPLTP